MKFGIGTAQFIENYGYMKKKIELDNYFEIFNKSNIDLVDTAEGYGNAHMFIGKYLSKKKKIVTKIGTFQNIQPAYKLEILKKKIEKNLKEMKRDSIYGLLFHDENDIFQDDKFFNYVDKLKKNNVIKKFGYSTYDITKNFQYNKVYNFDIVQAPINIFNLNQKKIETFKQIKKKIEIHVRSVFLQGLVLSENLKNNVDFNMIYKKLKILDKLITQRKFIDRHQIILSFLNNLKVANYCIIGCLNHFEILKLIKHKNKKTYLNDFKILNITNKKILDLRNWK